MIEGKIGMQAADDVEFRGAFACALLSALINFFQGKSISSRGIGVAAKSAEFAMRYADVCGIEVAIDVVVGDVALAVLANVVGEPADGEEIGRAVQGDAIFSVEACAGEHF